MTDKPTAKEAAQIMREAMKKQEERLYQQLLDDICDSIITEARSGKCEYEHPFFKDERPLANRVANALEGLGYQVDYTNSVLRVYWGHA